jgi:hypothetical protein
VTGYQLAVLGAMSDLWMTIDEVKERTPELVAPRNVQYRLRELRTAGYVEYRKVNGHGQWRLRQPR